MRPRLATLLDALTVAASDPSIGPEFALAEIEPQSPTHRLKGVATSSQTAADLARRLETALRGDWIVYPPEITPVTSSEGMMYRFSLLVEPVKDTGGTR